MLFGSLSAKHHKCTKYERETIDLKLEGQFYINHEYFLYLFKTNETNLWIAYLVNIKHDKPHICCMLDYEVASMFFPFLEEMPETYAGPSHYSKPDIFEGTELD
jgi:hypothetical protein